MLGVGLGVLMGAVGDICRKITALTPDQITALENTSSVLGLVGDISNAQVTIYVQVANKNFLVIVAQAKPNTSFANYKNNLLGTTVHASEEPIVWRTLVSGKHIAGQREWELGMDVLEMQTFPIHDADGKSIAAVSFETSGEEVVPGRANILVETAYMLLTSIYMPVSGSVYRPLSASDGIVIVNEYGQIIFANPVAVSTYKMLGVGRLVSRRVYDRQLNMKLAQKASNSQQPGEQELKIGDMILAQRAIPIVQSGRTVRTVVILTDITELKKKERELLVKAAVIQEIHHRVKNNLQNIASLLRLQARRSKSPEVKAVLQESINRILSISVVHEFLSQQDEEFINVAEVTKNILDLVIQNMLEPDFNIQTVFNGQTVILPSEQASSLALVINELISNAIEHGFVGRREGVIGIDVTTLKDSYQIDIYDNGNGLPPGFDPRTSNSLGLQIVTTLIENDLGGKFRMYSSGGTHACITIPKTLGEV